MCQETILGQCKLPLSIIRLDEIRKMKANDSNRSQLPRLDHVISGLHSKLAEHRTSTNGLQNAIRSVIRFLYSSLFGPDRHKSVAVSPTLLPEDGDRSCTRSMLFRLWF